MSYRRYGYFGPQPLQDTAPHQGTEFYNAAETQCREHVGKGPANVQTVAPKRGSGPDATITGYQPFSKNEPYEDRNLYKNHRFRDDVNNNRRPFLTDSCPKRSTGAASLYTTVTHPDPFQDRPEDFDYAHRCDKRCTPDYYHAKLVNQPDDRIKQRHQNLKSKPEGDPNYLPHLRYCMRGFPGGAGEGDDPLQSARPSTTPAGGPSGHGRHGPFYPRASGTRGDNPYAWMPDPYNDASNHPNFRGHSYRDGSFKAGKRPDTYFERNPHKRSIRGERGPSDWNDFLGRRGHASTLEQPEAKHNVFINGREDRAGVQKPYYSGGAYHHEKHTHVSPGPYEVQEWERKNIVHRHGGLFLKDNPRVRQRAVGRPRFQDAKY